MRQNWLINLGFILLIFVLSVIVVLPYFHAGYFPTHDGEWAVVRLGDMFRTLKDLQFPARYSGALNFGYGYPLFNFAYPLPYYLGIIFYFPFQSFVVSIKTMFVLSVFLSGIFMYFAGNALWKNRVAAFISAVIYIFLPYRMVDLYVRGSLGESIAFVLFPIIFYLVLKLFDSPFARLTVVTLTFCIAMLVMTHNIMTILFMPLLVAFVIVRIMVEKRWDVLQSFLLCIFLGAGVSFFFWFPALFEKGNILLSTIPIADRNLYFVKLEQLILPSWGYAPPTEVNGFTYQLGIGQLIVILLAFAILSFSFIKNKFTQTPIRFYSMILLGIYLLYFVMLFSITEIIWKYTPLLSEINYPWTLLSQLGFITALLSGLLVVQKGFFRIAAFMAVIIAIINTYPYAKPEKYNNYPDQYYLTNEATTTSSSELMPLWVRDFPKERYKSKIEVVKGDAKIKDLKFNSKFLQFQYKANEDSLIRVNTIYYPGWKGYVNNERAEIKYDNDKGVMEIDASKYRNTITLYLEETLIRTIANFVSIISILVIMFILIRRLLIFKT